MLPLLIVGETKIVHDYVTGYLKDLLLPSSSFLIYEKEKTSFSIDQIREIASLSVLQTRQIHVIVLYDFHTAKLEAQNAFLKTLEEASAHIQFILTSPHEDSVLATIISRCLVKKVKEKTVPSPINVSDEVVSKEQALIWCDQVLYMARQYIDKKLAEKKQQGHDLLDTISLAKDLIKTKSVLTKTYVSPHSSVDQILFRYPTLLDNLRNV